MRIDGWLTFVFVTFILFGGIIHSITIVLRKKGK